MPAPHSRPAPSRRQVLFTASAAAATTAIPAAPAAAAPPTTTAASGPATTEHRPASGPAPFPLSAVRLLDGPFLANMRRTCAYLLFVDPDRLLHTFRLNVGLPTSAEPCGGWEAPDVQLRGHSTGHLLSALAQAHANTGERAYADKGRLLVATLAECQRAAPAAGFRRGYLSAFPESVFDLLEAGGRPWAPYYTLHKIMAGLLDQYLLSGNREAFDVLLEMAAWTEARTAPLSHERMQGVLKVEFGGMNDVLARLHLETGDPVHLRTARRFDHDELYAPLAAGRDELAGRHANTEIAKVVGAVPGYEATGERRYLDIADTFWTAVVRHHSYAIGGNSDQELLGPPDEIASRLSDVTCENCNSYNMLKLGRHLFLHDPTRTEYLDHYEWTLYNQLLAEQDPDSEHGFVTYYTGLWAGSRREPKGGLGSAPGSYSGDYDNFSCDHGTGLETHTKFADTVYFRTSGTRRPALYVNLFIPSQVHWRETGVTLRQETDHPTGDRTRLTVTGGAARFALRIRVPGWLAAGDGRAELKVNGRRTGNRLEPGTYTTVTRHWRSGDRVDLVLPRVPVWRPAPDNPQVRSVSYGPLVLAGGYGDTPLATLPTVRPETLRRTPGEPTRFTAEADGRQVLLRPFHEVHHQRYNVYWSVEPRRQSAGDVARYPLDEGHGTSVADRTGTFADGSLAGGAVWTTDGGASAVTLDGRDGHVVLPAGLPSGLAELTVSVRVRADSLAPSARVFDLGYSKDTYLFLTATTGSGRARAALKIAGMETEDFVDATGPLPLGQWTHVALTLAGGTGVLYVDGAEAGRNPAMVASPLLLGRTSRNYLGRSQNSTHPHLHGAVRDFRLHNRALTAGQVRRLAQG
ncbi:MULTISPECIES: beta-L-arabinofuranosidase domain-containing protein [Streptomyces]|uniref:glycoside hydrolase family 127 protein n=1 Tax=Streptomyces TaxID=1883 RepID=UPI00240E1E67|nr:MULTISPECIES: beta-L-arabinofuranosidase domain-containing protein [Streptomyces]WFB81956.1 glycoside hydrolase family 127 protein [Streptomyces olivaceus]WGK44290.1 glycoside hydrolase family 127 protein [Streptomyces sp. B146]